MIAVMQGEDATYGHNGFQIFDRCHLMISYRVVSLELFLSMLFLKPNFFTNNEFLLLDESLQVEQNVLIDGFLTVVELVVLCLICATST